MTGKYWLSIGYLLALLPPGLPAGGLGGGPLLADSSFNPMNMFDDMFDSDDRHYRHRPPPPPPPPPFGPAYGYPARPGYAAPQAAQPPAARAPYGQTRGNTAPASGYSYPQYQGGYRPGAGAGYGYRQPAAPAVSQPRAPAVTSTPTPTSQTAHDTESSTPETPAAPPETVKVDGKSFIFRPMGAEQD